MCVASSSFGRRQAPHQGPGRARRRLVAKLGSGARFKAIEKAAAKSGADNPAAVAAAAGIARYGKKKMAKMAAAGRRKS
jgi:hypothetical protein